MAKTYLDIQNSAYKVGNIMDWTNALTRLSGVPVDITEVYNSYDKAVEYAATNPVAYEGQLITVTENGDTTVYVITPAVQGKYTVGEGEAAVEYDVNIKKVGTVPSGDNASITVTEAGLVSLYGFAGAENGMLPVREDGKLTWKTLEAIGAGDGNDNTTYEFALNEAKTGIIVTPLFNGQPIMEGEDGAQVQKKFELVLDVYTKAEADEKFLAKADYAEYDDTDLQTRVKAIEDDYLKEEDKYDDSALAARVKALEDEERYDETPLANRVTAVETAIGNAEGGLVKDIADNAAAITTEETRAKAAEEALGKRIDEIDFIDPTELENAIKDFATTSYVDGEIDKIEEAISNLNHFKAEVVDSIDKVKEVGVLYLIKDETVDGTDKYNEYIVVDDAPVLIGDTTTDLSNYYDKDAIDGKVEALEGAIADEATARGELAEKVAALEEVDNATQAELDAYKLEVTEEIRVAKEAAISDADGKLANKVNSSDFETFKGENTTAIGTAKQEAIDAAKAAEEAKGYAVATEVADTYATREALAGVKATADAAAVKADVDSALATKVDAATIAHTSDGVTESATIDGTTLNIVVDAYKKSETYTKDEVNTAITNKIGEMTGGESAADVLAALNDYKKANDAEIYGSEKVASWTDAEGKYTPVYSQDSRIDALAGSVAAAQAQADKGVADAAAAQAKADAAATAVETLTSGQVANNKADIDAVKGRLTTLETAKGDHETRLASAEGKITALEGADATINEKIGTIEGNVLALTNKDSEIDGVLATKANASDVYTKGEVDTKVQEAIDAIPEVDFTPYAKTADVNAALDLKANAADVYTKDEAKAEFMTQGEVDDRINALILAADPEGGKAITDIQNLVKYVEDNAGEIAGLVTTVDGHTTAIEKNAGDISAINDAIADMIQPKASAEISVAADGTLGINEMNVNKLVQTEGDTLVLNGGNAGTKAAE